MKKIKSSIKIFTILIFFSLILPTLCLNNNSPTKASTLDEYSNKNIKIKNFIFSFNFKFFNNRFVLYKQPNSNPPQSGYPIIFLFHGAVQHAFSWFFSLNIWNRAQTSFAKCALDNDFFIVSFESIKQIRPGPRAWNVFEKDVIKNTDISFVKNVIDWLENSSLPVNTNNIYCAGFSSGAFMCSRLSQSLNYSFKGVVINSGCNADCITLTNFGPTFDCGTGYNISDFHPPTLLIHGMKDTMVPFECAESYYQDLKDNSINVSTLFSELDGHIWLKRYNNEVIDWMKQL